MLDEVAPEVIWISGLGAIVVFGFMMAVWYVSTRESTVKKLESSPNAVLHPKPIRRRKQYGSPRKKKEGFTFDESTQKDTTPLKSVQEESLDAEEPDTVLPQSSLTSEIAKPQESKLKFTKPSKGSDKNLTKVTESYKPVSHNVAPKKPKAKPKQLSSESDIMAGFQIAEAIENSTLSDDDIQMIMDKLLEKHEEEWEATNKSDNIKNLKKANEELHVRCQDAEKSALILSNRVKELSADLKSERVRFTAIENSYQAKIGKLVEDGDNMKKKISKYTDEIETLKKKNTVADIGKLESENQSFQQQLSQIALEKSQSDAQLAAQKNEIKQLHDDKGKLVKEIQLLTESKRKLTSVESEKTHIQNELHKSHSDIQQLKSENEKLQNAEEKLKQEIKEMKENVNIATEGKETALISLTKKDEKNIELLARLDVAENELKKEKVDHLASIQSLNDKHNADIERVKNETQHNIDKLNTTIHQLEAERSGQTKEMGRLHAQNSSLEENAKKMADQIRSLTESLSTLEVDQKQLQESNNAQDLVDAVTKERDELKKENSDMQSKINNLKEKNTILRDNCWTARDELEKASKEHTQFLEQIKKEHKKHVAELEIKLDEQQVKFKGFLQTLLPSLQDDVSGFDEWFENAKHLIDVEFKSHIEIIKQKDKRIEELILELDEGSSFTDNLRNTLSETMEKLEDLMKRWEEKEQDYNEAIDNEKKLRLIIEEELNLGKEKIMELEKESKLQKALQDNETITQQLHQSNESTSILKENIEVLQKKLEEAVILKTEVVTKKDEREEILERQLSDMATKKKQDDEKLEVLEHKLKEYESKLIENEKLIDSLRGANKDLNFRLIQQAKFNASPVAATSSEV